MHHIHTTQGLIIHSKSYGEANKILHIFTKDLGLIFAVAQGVRFEKSKLRYNIQDYRFANFSLVKGKEYWRIVGCESLMISNDCYIKNKNQILSRVSSIIMRLIHGEEKHEEIYKCLYDFVQVKIDQDSLEYLSTLESLLVIRILYRLGYVGSNIDFDETIKDFSFDHNIVFKLISKRGDLNKIINKALKESHL